MRRLTRIALTFLLIAGCSSGRIAWSTASAPRPPLDPAVSPWIPIGLSEVARDDFRAALDQLLRVTGPNLLWPGFSLDDHGVILVDNRRRQNPEVICVGLCANGGGAGKSRLWKWERNASDPAALVFASGHDWGLPQQNDVVVAYFEGTSIVVFVLLHEDFHLTFQGLYGVDHPNAFDPPRGAASSFTREQLEHSYVADEETLRSVRAECSALTAALRAASAHDETASRGELRRFVTLREARRARPGAPVFEEDYWERLEGVPTNLERRVAAMLDVRDPSVIQSALDDGCDIVGPASYLIVLGGLEAALLDHYDPLSWPSAVYPSRGHSTSLYELLGKHAAPRERN